MLDELPDDLLRNVIIHTSDKDDVVKIFQLNHRMRVFSKEKKLAVMWSEEQDGIVNAFHDALQWVRDEDIARSMIPRMTTTERMVAYVGAPDMRAWRDHLLPGPEHINDLIPYEEDVRAHLLHFAHTVEDVRDMLTLPGIDANVRDTLGLTPLLAAVARDMMDVAMTLVEVPSIDVNKADPYGVTPLHLAAQAGHVAFVGKLLRAGADINATDESNITPLYEAALYRQRRVVELLVSTEGVAVNAASANGITALHVAAFHGYPEIIPAITSHPGVNLNMRITERQYAPLHFAVERGYVLTAQMLLEAGADVNIQNDVGVTPLIMAVQRINDVMTSTIVGAPGVDLNMRSGDSRTPLHVALVHNVTAAKMLIDAGADVNARTAKGVTPLHLAVLHNHIAVIKTLIAAGVDVNARTHNGATPMHFGVLKNRARAVELLIAAGADVNMVMDDGHAPLHVAVGQKQASVVQVLLAVPGINVNIQTADGQMLTPLHIAAIRGNAEIVLAILGTRGVDRHMCTAEGHDAVHVALDYKHDEVVSLIQNAMEID